MPVGSVVTESVAKPPLTAVVPSGVEPFMNVTEPVGVLTDDDTVAVRVNGSPTKTEPDAAARPMLAGALFTVRVMVPVAVAYWPGLEGVKVASRT